MVTNNCLYNLLHLLFEKLDIRRQQTAQSVWFSLLIEGKGTIWGHRVRGEKLVELRGGAADSSITKKTLKILKHYQNKDPH